MHWYGGKLRSCSLEYMPVQGVLVGEVLKVKIGAVDGVCFWSNGTA